MKSTLLTFLICLVSACGIKAHSDSDADAPAPSQQELKLDSSAIISDKTVPNPNATPPNTHSLIQSYNFSAASDVSLMFQEKNSSHVCTSGEHFEGPLVSITKPDGTNVAGENIPMGASGPHVSKLRAASGINKIIIQFFSDGPCNVQLEFSLIAMTEEHSVPPGTMDKDLIGQWTKSDLTHSHKIVSKLEIVDGGVWSSKVTLNESAVYDIDFTARTNTAVTPHQLELTARTVRQASKDNPEKVGDSYHCIYKINSYGTGKNLVVSCFAKGQTFYPTEFASDRTEIYYSGDVTTDFATLVDQTNLSLSIPDNNTTGLSYTFDVTNESTVGDLSVFVSLTHRYLSEVRITLTDPRGTGIPLTGEQLTKEETVFGHNGRSITKLGELRGKSAKGRWTLTFTDNASGDIGTIRAIRVLNYP